MINSGFVNNLGSWLYIVLMTRDEGKSSRWHSLGLWHYLMTTESGLAGQLLYFRINKIARDAMLNSGMELQNQQDASYFFLKWST